MTAPQYDDSAFPFALTRESRSSTSRWPAWAQTSIVSQDMSPGNTTAYAPYVKGSSSQHRQKKQMMRYLTWIGAGANR